MIFHARAAVLVVAALLGLSSPPTASQEPAPLRLTRHPAWDYHPVFSPDGSQILFTSQRSGEPALWLVPAEGGEVTPVSIEGSGDFYASWAPDGKSMIIDLVVGRGPPDLFRFWFASRDLERLSDSPGMDVHPSFSPDGREILFSSMRGGLMDIWIMNADGTAPRPVLRDEPHDWHPSWSPDGTRIVFESDRGEGESQVWVVNRDGSGLRQVTQGPAMAGRASWSPDGSLILFERSDDLWVVSSGGGEPVRLTDRPGRDGNAAWSPDGTRIVVSAHEENNSDLWIIWPDPDRLEVARGGGG